MNSDLSQTQPLPEMAHDPRVTWLKFAVVAMGVLILVGIAAVVGRIMYMASQAPKTSASSVQSVSAHARLPLPSGASVRHLAFSGDRVAVEFEAPSGPGIVVLDAVSGRVLSRIDVVPEPPAQ